MPFIISEDQALKDHLQGLVVTDQNNDQRKVTVYYRMPEAEERRISYPFITIDLIDIEEEKDRAHRGRIGLDYVPDGYDPAPVGADNLTEFPIPVSLLYQITTHTRSAWHDRVLQAQLMANKIPFRFGALEVKADNTVRRLDFLGFDQADALDAQRKRVFRKAYTIAVSSELYPDAVLSVQQVASVGISLYSQLESFIVEPTNA